ncbi:hypothetical protein [Haliangium sp.]|uniref:hypothetical protein n=1 Tax=Haliangium sp. TaxID=2663208 RepID=UPI003D131D47
MKKKIKKSKRKLQVSRHTLRLLNGDSLTEAAGGGPTFSCQTISCNLTDCC